MHLNVLNFIILGFIISSKQLRYDRCAAGAGRMNVNECWHLMRRRA